MAVTEQGPPPEEAADPAGSQPEAEAAEAAEAEGAAPARKPVPGVLYLSHLPPGFGPRQARALLGVHGELGRVFLQPCGGSVRRRRQRRGRFTEGWVEFRDKRAARRAAAALHGAPMGTRPRSRFRHERWCLKYLPGFRWPHLSERLAGERQARAQRLRAEAAQAKREGGFYRRCAAMAGRGPPPGDPAPTGDPAPRWGFAQRRPPAARGPAPRPSPRLLARVFGKGEGP